MSRAKRLEGRPAARELRERLRGDIERFVTHAGRSPAAAGVLVGNDSSSVAYFRSLRRSFERLSIALLPVELPADSSPDFVSRALDDLNADTQIDGVLVFQPLPRQIPSSLPSEVIDPAKDIDGATTESAGRLALGLSALMPSTPAGGMAILRHYQIPIAGAHAVVVGRSPVVGKPMATLLLAADATVTVCHSRTSDLAALTRQADIVALAAGHPGILTADMVKPGASVIDFGVTVIDGNLIGDAAENVWDVAGAVTPVPGGTGVVTIAILARNTVIAAAKAAGVSLGDER